MKVLCKWVKKWALKIQKSPISEVFLKVRFPGDPKTALNGDPSYFVSSSFHIEGPPEGSMLILALILLSFPLHNGVKAFLKENLYYRYTMYL